MLNTENNNENASLNNEAGKEETAKPKSKEEGRRKFLKFGALAALGLTAAGCGWKDAADEKQSGEKVKFINPNDGKVYEADASLIEEYKVPPVTATEARIGIPNRKFVMVIDLSRCEGCRKCTMANQKAHFIPSDREWMKVFKMQESKETAPYFMPRPCFHCDKPLCTKVCPVNATFKRQDGIVLIDNERCIGCRSCMAACPYSARSFNWSDPSAEEMAAVGNIPYTPERGFPRKKGTVEKCDFCPDMARQGKLPHCVSGCPMGTLYFGDQNEDAVTNGLGQTVKFSQFIEDNAGYRYMEELGTEPRVYYLPPKNRRGHLPDMNSDVKEKC